MSKKLPTPEDIELFRQAMKHVIPLKRRVNTHLSGRREIVVRPAAVKKITDISLQDENYVGAEPGAFLFYADSTVRPQTLKQLRKGTLHMQLMLDLHGMTVARAKIALQECLARCKHKKIRTLLIIHGKGTATIKSAVNTWLRNYPETLAFSSATAKDGGAGALYLLLRKSY
jgi:DNA-nicking Smr family endonuclease